MMNEKWQVYDPQWLIDLAKEQIPDKPEIILALSKCIKANVESRTFIYFVNGDLPNQPNAEWQFDQCIQLEDKEKGTIILDVLKGNRIGGIEFLP
ncbi:MAG: hypothetical protein AAGA77_17830 [Bacteroidota bacterium]